MNTRIRELIESVCHDLHHLEWCTHGRWGDRYPSHAAKIKAALADVRELRSWLAAQPIEEDETDGAK